MYFHIILTERCNSQCKYCYKKSEKEFDNLLLEKFEFDFNVPADLNIDLIKLKKFLEKAKSQKIIFYGGEPLVNIEKLKEIMDFIPDAEYYLQTNGKLLNQLPKKYINKFKKILISIDGDKEKTDFNRGKGTYELVLENLKKIRKIKYPGEIVARMTISFSLEKNKFDLQKQIIHLLDIGFDSVHWQLDMGFYQFDYNEKKVSEFLKKYNKEITKTIKWWIDEMNSGKVVKIYPFFGIFESVYYNKTTNLRCGSGYANYTITTNGKIVPCPIMNSIKNFYIGDIENSDPENLKKIPVIEPCVSCDYLDLCGGRCLYANYAKLWPDKGQQQICNSIKYLIEEIKNKTPEIKKLIEKKIIKESDFYYEKYFGPEIIP